jgi:uncharacterized protein YbjQ (UPF0145 family)
MIISTTETFEGRPIQKYLGVVFGETVNGVNYVRDLSASLTGIFGGRSTDYEEELMKTRADAINEMVKRATQIGANAIVGMHIDYEVMAENMLLVVASGTAVVI